MSKEPASHGLDGLAALEPSPLHVCATFVPALRWRQINVSSPARRKCEQSIHSPRTRRAAATLERFSKDRRARLTSPTAATLPANLGSATFMERSASHIIQPRGPAIVRMHAKVAHRTLWSHCGCFGSAQTKSCNKPAENLRWQLRVHTTVAMRNGRFTQPCLGGVAPKNPTVATCPATPPKNACATETKRMPLAKGTPSSQPQHAPTPRTLCVSSKQSQNWVRCEAQRYMFQKLSATWYDPSKLWRRPNRAVSNATQQASDTCPAQDSYA